ncbi:serine/threonine-protein kinase [Gemmata palustris]|nr:serine/threonine-protein kinase [Gemmata palustris]
MALLNELLFEWEERRKRGEIVTPEQLCPHDPATRAELAKRILLLEQFDQTFCVDEPIPEKIGKYEIRGVLGEGGMGVVYLGFDPTLKRLAAVKTISSGHLLITDAVAEQRFALEGQVLARLTHPNIVTVYEGGSDEGCSYLAMEHISGGSVAAARERITNSSPLEIASLMTKVARAVHYAHAQKSPIYHRDLKPSNILLTEDGEPKVADFGLAKLFEPDPPPEPTANTLTGTFDTPRAHALTTVGGRQSGTPGYMAPEQVGEPITAATDVWALGVILHELLTGEPPTPVHPPDPGAVVTAVPGHLGRQLAAIIRRCLQRSPSERYVTAGELADALRALGQPSRRKVLRAGLAAGVVALAGGVPVGFFAADPYRRFCWRTRGVNRRLERGETVELIDPDAKREPDYFLLVGHGATDTEYREENWVVRSTAFSLLELVPRLPPGCRIQVELRHQHSNFGANLFLRVGIVFGISSVLHNGETVQFVSHVSFDDVGGLGWVQVGAIWPVGRRGVMEPKQYYPNNASQNSQVPVPTPTPFRVVELTLPPINDPISWSGPPPLSLIPVRDARARGMPGFANDYPNELIDQIEARYSHRIGLIVSGGAIKVRSVRIIPPQTRQGDNR